MREILNDIVSEDKRAGEVIQRLRQWLKKGEVQQHSLRINKVVRGCLEADPWRPDQSTRDR